MDWKVFYRCDRQEGRLWLFNFNFDWSKNKSDEALGEGSIRNLWAVPVTKSEQIFNFHDCIMIFSSIWWDMVLELCNTYILNSQIWYAGPDTHTERETHTFGLNLYEITLCKCFVLCVRINCITKVKKRLKFQKGHRCWCLCPLCLSCYVRVYSFMMRMCIQRYLYIYTRWWYNY